MKKGLIFSLIISFICFLGLSIFAFLPKTNFSTDKIEEFNKFESSLISELQNDDYSYTEINKNITLSELKKKIEPNSKKNQATISRLEDNKILTTNELTNYCEANDLLLEKTESGYQVINKYALKRLIIFGSLPINHNANKVLSYDDMHILCYTSIESTKSAYLNLTKNNISVVVDFILSASNDNTASAQSTFNNWSEQAVDLNAYTDYRTDKQAVVVVLDSGINTLHPIFTNRLLKENNKIVGSSYEYTSYTYNQNNIQLTNSLSFEDDNGHGSHVAGIIASQTPSNVKILPMRVLNKEGKGDFTKIITALKKVDEVYSNSYNVVCTNLSLSGAPSSDYFSTGLTDFNNIFNKLKAKNILSVVAAGNDNKNTSTYLPAACGESAIIVSALSSNSEIYYNTNNLIKASYSNFGSSIDISAPGSSINSAWKASINNASTANQTEIKGGTSMAAPHVSACIAKLCLDNDFNTSSTPSYTASQIEEILLSSALDLDDNGKDIYFGHGALRYTNINAKTEPTQTISHTAYNAIFTYDGNYHNISVNVTQPTSGYTIKYSLEDDGVYNITNITSNVKFKNANTSGITVYYQISAPNCGTVTGSKTLTINKRLLNYSLSNQTSTYGNTNHLNQTKYTKTSGTVVSGDDLGITLSTTANRYSSVGTYNINLTHTNTNYTINSNTATLTINPKEATINVINLTLSYGENFALNQLTYTTTGLVNGESINNISLSTNAVSGINPVGSYTINATYTPNNNYIISVNSGTLTINPKNATIVLQNQASVYGETINLDQTKYSITGIVGTDTINNIKLLTTATNTVIKNYDITATYTPNNNYSITIEKGTYAVTKRSLALETTNQTFTYDEVINLDQTKYTIKSGNFAFNDKNSVVLTSNATTHLNAGSYDINLTFNNIDKYNLTLTKGKAIINQRILKIEITNSLIANQTIEYGNELNLDENSYKIKSGIILNKDKSSFKINLTSETNPNNTESYLVYAQCSNSNYSIILENNQITIVPRKLSITVNNQNFDYGDDIILNQLDYTITEGSFAFNDQASVILSTNAYGGCNATEYEINLTFNNMSKYNLTINGGKAIINPRNITISTQQNKIYGEENNLNNSLFTIESGNIIDGTDLQLNFTTTAIKTSPVGDYEIELLSCNPNYNITLVNSCLTINPKLIEIYVSNQAGTYGNIVKLDQTQYFVDSLDIVEGSDLEIQLSTNASHTKSVGTYTITASTTNPNYVLDVNNGVYTINKRKISIRLYNQSIPNSFNIVYNTEDYDIMSGSIVGNDDLNIKLSTNATAMSFAGDYKIMATYLNDNYDVTFTEATLTLEFSYVDALMILVPTAILILVATLVLVVIIKRKNKSTPLYKKWTK